MHIDPEARASRRTGDVNEAQFSNNVAFGKCEAIVIKCTKIAKSSISLDVLGESRSMISKMRYLLDPNLRCEVDYTEAAKDCSNVLHQWTNN